MWLIKPVVVCFSTKMSLCPPPHKPPCWLEKAADSWSKILPFPLAENLSGLVSCQSSQIPVMKLKQTSGTWCLVAIGSWCGLHSFLWSLSVPQLQEDSFCELWGSSTRGAFKVISATCLVGDRALVVTTFHMSRQEHCWPSLSELMTKLALFWLPTLLLGKAWLQASSGWWLPQAPCCYAVGCFSKRSRKSFNNVQVMAASVLQYFLSLIVQILSASSWLCFGWVWQLKSILNSNWALRILN